MFNVASAHNKQRNLTKTFPRKLDRKHSYKLQVSYKQNKKTFLTTVITKLSYRIDFGKLLQMSHVPPSFRPCPRTSTNVSTQ